MIVQAIALLDDLDKEVNIYSMRVKVCKISPKIWDFLQTKVLVDNDIIFWL
jgi:hypothetical protein